MVAASSLFPISTANAGPRDWILPQAPHLEYVGELEPVAAEAVAQEVGEGVQIGFRYQRHTFLSMEVWGSRGKYVLYRDDHVFGVPQARIPSAAGVESIDELPKPWRYSFPPGLMLLVGAAFSGLAFGPNILKALGKRRR